jgi:hypothetical protein
MNSPAAAIVLFVSAFTCAINVAAADNRAVLIGCCSTTVTDGQEPIALTQAVPSQMVIRTVTLGADIRAGAYDLKDNLLLISNLQTVEVVTYPGLTIQATVPTASSDLIRVFGDTVYALGGNAIYKFSPSTATITATTEVPVGGDYQALPSGAELSADGKLLYALYNYSDQIGDAKNPSGAFSAVMYVFDTSSMTVVSTWNVPYDYAGALVFSGLGQKGYYTAGTVEGDAAIVACDLYTGVATASMPLGDPQGDLPTNPVLSADKSTVYVGVGPELFALNAESLAIDQHVPTSYIIVALTPSLDRRYLYLTGDSYGYSILNTPEPHERRFDIDQLHLSPSPHFCAPLEDQDRRKSRRATYIPVARATC